MSVFCGMCLVVLGAVGPENVANLTIKAGESEFSFNRHEPTEEEKENILELISSADDLKDLEGNAYVKAAEERAWEERSSLDYLLLARVESLKKEPAKALEYAYTGRVLETKDPEVQAQLSGVIGQSFKQVGEPKTGNKYLQEKRELLVNPEVIKRLGTQRLSPSVIEKPEE